jgi:hypothetical protein
MSTVTVSKKKTVRKDRPNLLASGDQEALRNAGAGSLSDYAKQAHAEGGTLTLSPEEAAASGAGFVQDLMKMETNDEDGGGEEIPAPTLTSLAPNTAVLDSADLTLACIGSGFTADSKIVFAGQDEPTTFDTASRVTTGVKPSLGWGAVTVDVYVKNGGLQSAPLGFTFTEPTSRTKK